MDGIDQIYVLHCKQGYEDRARSVESQFREKGLDFEYVLDWDVPELTPSIRERYFPGEPLPASLMSLCLKHLSALRRVLERGQDRCIIFEDDILLNPEFARVIPEVARESRDISQDHVVYLSNSCNEYTPRSRRRRGQRLYEADHSRAADAYLVSAAVCRKRIAWIERNGFSLPIDHQFYVMDRELGIRFYWAEDPVAEQGSMNGVFPSHLENRYSARVRKIRWQLDKFYKRHVLRNLR